MNRVISLINIIIISLIINSCQYPVDLTELPDTQQFIVIDAELTETYGSVNVNYSLTEIDAKGGYNFPTPPNASAYVLDSKGNRTDFKSNGEINFGFKGVIGETYKLYITVDGQSYESTAETMRACPELDTVSVFYTRESGRIPDDLNYDGFDVYAELTDIAGEENFYEWDWIHYEKAASCNIIMENNQEVRVPCFPSECWDITYNRRIIVQADKLRDGEPIAHKVVRVPYATPPNKYYLRVEQRAITPTVFEYLKSLETQTQNIGSQFDIPAQTQFSPNIYNVNNPSEKIIGVFSVFSSRYKVIYIDMLQEIPNARAKFIGTTLPFTSDPFASFPCVEGKYRTKIKPEGWID
ncbi:MAG: DUF4249 family protein [Saprospiraceae bacterium]|nr:DUF4249 family protein [Saprospiraceae bacterium]